MVGVLALVVVVTGMISLSPMICIAGAVIGMLAVRTRIVRLLT